MAVTTPIPAALNGAKLREELAAADITIGPFDFSLEGSTLYFRTLSDTQQQAVRAVVAAHQGGLTKAEQLVAEGETATDGLRQYRAKIRQVAAGQAQFTVAERDAILARLALRALRERPE